MADGFDDLELWAADARAREAADERVRERWLRTQAEEGARFVDVMVGLAERAAAVAVTLSSGRQVTGALTGVGVDFVAVRARSGATTLVVSSSVAGVRELAGDGQSGGLRLGPESVDVPGGGGPVLSKGSCLVDVLAQAVGDRRRVVVQSGAMSVAGDLRAVGLDVVVVQTADDQPAVAYVPLASVSDVSFLASG